MITLKDALLGGLVGGAHHQLGGHGVLLPLPRHYRDQGAPPTRTNTYMSGENNNY